MSKINGNLTDISNFNEIVNYNILREPHYGIIDIDLNMGIWVYTPSNYEIPNDDSFIILTTNQNGTMYTNLIRIKMSNVEIIAVPGDIYSEFELATEDFEIVTNETSPSENNTLVGSALGDPYIYPLLSSTPVKLPNKDAFYRLYENSTAHTYINAHVSKATPEHQQRMLSFAKLSTTDTGNIVCNGFFFDQFQIISEENSICVNPQTKHVSMNTNTYFRLEQANDPTYTCPDFHSPCRNLLISWRNQATGGEYKVCIHFFANPHVENGISVLKAETDGAIGCLVDSYKPKLMELPSISTKECGKLKRRLAKAKNVLQTKRIQSKTELWCFEKTQIAYPKKISPPKETV
jgi:hypothetical protein